jgi:hypothetical protein
MELSGVVAQAIVVAVVAQSRGHLRAGAEFVLPFFVEKSVELLSWIRGPIVLLLSCENIGSKENEKDKTWNRD